MPTLQLQHGFDTDRIVQRVPEPHPIRQLLPEVSVVSCWTRVAHRHPKSSELFTKFHLFQLRSGHYYTPIFANARVAT